MIVQYYSELPSEPPSENSLRLNAALRQIHQRQEAFDKDLQSLHKGFKHNVDLICGDHFQRIVRDSQQQ